MGNKPSQSNGKHPGQPPDGHLTAIAMSWSPGPSPRSILACFTQFRSVSEFTFWVVPSADRVATVDYDVGTVDHVGAVRDQEQDCRRDLLGEGETAGGDLGLQRVALD